VEKICTACDTPKLLSEYHVHKLGKFGRNSICKLCKNKYTSKHRIGYKKRFKELRELRKAKLIEFLNIEKSKPCVDCGKSFIPEAMHFDHLPQFHKVKHIADMVNRVYSISTVQKELQKCELVCVGCHRDRTKDRNELREHYSCSKHKTYQEDCRLCKICDRVRINKRKFTKFIESLKDKECVDCGQKFQPHKMDFDHFDDKLEGISDLIHKHHITSRHQMRIIEEIQKCELVCCWCHVNRTISRRSL